MEQIKLFFEKVKIDKSLQTSLKEFAERKAGIEEIVALAKGKGFGFTKEDLVSLAKVNPSAGELNEEQLAAVSGGAAPAGWIFNSQAYTNCGGTITPSQVFTCTWEEASNLGLLTGLPGRSPKLN